MVVLYNSLENFRRIVWNSLFLKFQICIKQMEIINIFLSVYY